MKKLFITLLFSALAYSAQSQSNEVFDALLKTYVTSDGMLDYKGLRKNKAVLDIYLNQLEATIPTKKWSSKKAKAFWMNAYNAYTIKLIIDSYPLKKLTDIKIKGRNAWKLPFAKVGKKTYSLDYIEHKILRRWHDDARIHVGVNAGSVSGPKFPNYAFTAKNIDQKLESLMSDFINDASKNKISLTEIQVSKIFEWYQEDFTSNTTLVDYINKYSKTKVNDNAKVSYLEYDWSLNDK
ncbi:DUF547 domain-containing protein [Tenacibaculum jejuense]|uniref:DUF547 domain-containing protein n=1 Tax=Tenacibaculum jejuense TaxID=584609 RepID=A0A238U4U5_9FLAO|nr:DUF547 domain-containing protein [Tenacibaculum jejuense]SNR14221.1 Protein of unknown function precursor [Tenacibaculum jejuense]